MGSVVSIKPKTLKVNFSDEVRSRILDVRDISGEGIARVRVIFRNGFQLSIIRGWISDGEFELAIFNKFGVMDGSLLDLCDQGDQVLKGCSLKKIEYYLEKVSELRCK